MCDRAIGVRSLLETRLKRLGCKTDKAEDGVQAVEMLRSADDGFYQLVLMDIRMPRMDGYEATQIAKHELGCKMPIVAVSAEDIVEPSYTELFDGFQPKPLSVDALTKLLSTFLSTSLPTETAPATTVAEAMNATAVPLVLAEASPLRKDEFLGL
ncbi:CheY-like superfamily [Pavlovales sp. CCMP2436]|nr:CheY-like superfamily [Pavlovales sp. CCMP2436]